MNRPSSAQIEGLVEFLEQNPGIAKGLLRTVQAKLETKRKWSELATSLNALGGAIKDGQGWAKYWAEKKCALKKQCAVLSASTRRTGGGTAHNMPILSALDNRLVAVMGGQGFATGDETLTVNPFPESTIPIEVVPIEDAEMHSEPVTYTIPSPLPSSSQVDTIQATPIIPPATPVTAQSTVPRPPRRRSSIPRPVDTDMERFARIEERRVEAEMTTAQAFAQLSVHMGNIANALMEIARKMPEP